MNEEKSKMENELQATNKLLLEMVKNQKNNTKALIRLYITTVICFMIIIVSMVIAFVWYESQFESINTTETTCEQEVSGNDSEINNVEGNLYKDNATHNDGKE